MCVVGLDGRPYDELARILYSSKKDDDKTPLTQRFSESDEFSLLPVGETFSRLTIIGSMTQTYGWPPPILPIRFFYASTRKVFANPRFITFENEDEFLCQIVMDMQLADLVGSQCKKDSNVAVDANLITADCFHNALSPIWRDAKVTVVAVFAAKLLLHVRDMNPSGLQSSFTALPNPPEGTGSNSRVTKAQGQRPAVPVIDS